MKPRPGPVPAPAPVESAFILVGLLVATGVLNPIFNDFSGTRAETYTDPNPARLAVTLVLYGSAAILAALRWRRTLPVLIGHPLVVAAILLPLASLFWSVDPATTLRRASAHALTGAFCIYLASTLRIEDLFRRLTLTCLIGALLSLAYVAVAPDAAIHDWGGLRGSWRGVYGHKNELGQAAILGIIVALFSVGRSRRDTLIRLATFGLSLALLTLSRSATSWLVLAAMILVVPVGGLLRDHRFTSGVRLLFASLLVVAAIGIASQSAGLALELLGRDFSFTGRTTLWRAVWDVVETRFPVLGAGYGAFFTPSGAVPDLAPHLTHWGGVPNHAHSGFLDTLANLGWPGVAVLGLLMLSSFCRVLDILLRRQASRVWIGVLAFQVLFLINNFSESSAFRHADPIWILFLVMACQTAPGLNVRSRPRAPLPRLRAARLTSEAA